MNGTPLQLPESRDDEGLELGLENYVCDLYNHIELQFKNDQDLKKFKCSYQLFKKSYSVSLRWNVYDRYVDLLLDMGKPKEALEEWVLIQEEEWEGWNKDFSYRDSAIDRLIDFEQELKARLINGYFIEKIAPKGSQLTSFGKRNKEEVLIVIDTILSNSEEMSFFEKFYKNYSFELTTRRRTFSFEYYHQFFEHNSKGQKELQFYLSKREPNYGGAKLKDGSASMWFVKRAINQRASSLLREAENEYRLNIGAKKIGEDWISETELFYKVKTAFPQFEVIHHGRPEWLGRQHFDIWIPEIRVAMEYQGQQHDKPVEFFGGEKAFKENKRRDELKKQKCNENNVVLIEVRKGYDFHVLKAEIEQIITK
jgi:hypothetical protein